MKKLLTALFRRKKKSSLKSRAEEIKTKYNHKFKN